jgi:hypothetical protein
VIGNCDGCKEGGDKKELQRKYGHGDPDDRGVKVAN